MNRKNTSVFICKECSASSTKWAGRCTACGAWNSLVESAVPKRTGTLRGGTGAEARYIRYPDLPKTELLRLVSGIAEFDRVLGGGAVPGSLILLGGEPGIGKSTILLQASDKYSANGLSVMYVSGEESASQIRFRGERLGVKADTLFFLAETDLETILSQMNTLKPDVVMIDSIQTVRPESREYGLGSTAQLRETAASLLEVSKKSGTVIFMTGHVTKEGLIAGPKAIEHIADTVLYFEGEKNYRIRLIRAVKNRFGPAGELGIFEMRNEGLVPIEEASSLFISESLYDSPGAVVFPSHEGTRPLLVEIQALVSQSGYATPRRTVVSLDYNRAILVLAVLEKRMGIVLSNREVFISAAGGVFISEPAADLAVAAAVLSSYYDKPVKRGTALFGELGLTGEIREVSGVESRIKEAVSHKYGRIIAPKLSKTNLEKYRKADIIEVSNLIELHEHLI
jgi:DNA repair protein RadA/Sms